jgi:hypothetical protein
VGRSSRSPSFHFRCTGSATDKGFRTTGNFLTLLYQTDGDGVVTFWFRATFDSEPSASSTTPGINGESLGGKFRSHHSLRPPLRHCPFSALRVRSDDVQRRLRDYHLTQLPLQLLRSHLHLPHPSPVRLRRPALGQLLADRGTGRQPHHLRRVNSRSRRPDGDVRASCPRRARPIPASSPPHRLPPVGATAPSPATGSSPAATPSRCSSTRTRTASSPRASPCLSPPRHPQVRRAPHSILDEPR